ncbi:MAG: SDR family oxidoreductase [Flavobacteriaceae bacterium]|nr:SDR family oxidoreductase [Flavobacteriaceae bacterium]
MKRKNILITGGAGFIGSHLCRKLVLTGHNITCLDNLLTGSKKNIKDLILKPNFKFIEHDIIEPYFNEQIEEIYNLACPASPFHYQINPIKTIKTNTVGVINMLGLAKKNRAKILQASTSEVYGDPEIHPQSEIYNGNVNMIGPRSCYDEGKRCAETLFMDYHRSHKLNIKIARIFNTYGPNMACNDGRVVSNFILQALKGDDITINGDGDQTRSFMYIDDLVKGFILLMNSENNFVDPINLGNPHEITINELALTILKHTNSNSKIIYKEIPKDDPKRRKPDISLAYKILGWKPNISLNTGLDETIQYFKYI